jgi:predicted ATPase/DNA-binding SARP family transcriptional activator
MSADARVEFRVLGPLEVLEDGRRVRVQGRKPRALLAMLALHPGTMVSADRLAEALWGEEPPVSTAGTLQVYVSQLRKVLGAQTIQTRSPGYVLAVEPERVDAVRFERLVAEGRSLAEDDPAAAVERLDQALSLWRGPALADFAFEDFARSNVARLEELRLVALEERNEAELALGRHDRLAGPLRALVEEQPLRERLWGQLVLALYRSGRQAEALRACSDVRRLLVEELGVEPGPALRELEQSILRHDPALDRPTAVSTTDRTERESVLPRPRSSFVGRLAELDQLDELLERPRLVTLVGPGGVGKTRMAVEVARRVLGRFPGGVWLVELAPLADASLVTETVAAVLGVPEEDGRPLLDCVIAAVAGKRALLILDNCEHVIDSVAALADALLAGSPALSVLATSRAPLRVEGETVWRAPSLAMPPDDAQSFESLMDYDAVRLFCERSRSEGAFPFTDADLPVVVALCRRLDGIPLAIDLAAAHTRPLGPRQILGRLEDRFALLTKGRRTAPPRHRTLRGAVEWSFELLDEREQTVFRRLSVFAGRISLEAAEGVCSGDDVSPAEVIPILAALVERSMVEVDDDAGSRSFRLLETLRAFGANRLAESGEAPAICERHLRFFLSWVRAQASSEADRGRSLFEVFEAERDNLRAALRWATIHDSRTALELAALLAPLWHGRGPYRWEGCSWIEESLSRTPDVDPDVRASALVTLADLYGMAGDPEKARRAGHAARSAYQSLGDWTGVAEASFRIAAAEMFLGRYDEAHQLYDEGIRLRGRLAADLPPSFLHDLGDLALRQDDPAGARRWFSEALAAAQKAGTVDDTAMVLRGLAQTSEWEGDDSSAVELYEQALAVAPTTTHRSAVCALAALAVIRQRQGQADDAWQLMAAALERVEESGERWPITLSLLSLAELCAARGEDLWAAQALGTAEAAAEAVGVVIVPRRRRWIPDVEQRMGSHAFAAARAHGRLKSIDEGLSDARRWAAGSGFLATNHTNRGRERQDRNPGVDPGSDK